MTGRFVFVVACVLISTSYVSAQSNYLYTFDVASGTVDSVELTEPNEWIAEATPWTIGSLNNKQPLPISVSTDSFVVDQTTRMFAARQQFDITSYPVRCAASMRSGNVDSTRHACSAVLVGNRWALTAAHCVMTFKGIPYTFVQRDTYLAPAWDEGQSQTAVGPSKVVRIYVVRKPGSSPVDNDIALLELEEPIGNELGWVGLYTAPPASWIQDQLVHRFSYPAGEDLRDSTLVFDGNDLMCRQGYLESITPRYVRSSGVFGIPGESGSPVVRALFGGYVTTGVLSFASGLNSRVIDSTTFAAFEKVMYGPTASVDEDHNPVALHLQPNPTSDIVTIGGLTNGEFQRATVVSMRGNVVATSDSPQISCQSLSNGHYLVVIETTNGRFQRNLTVLR